MKLPSLSGTMLIFLASLLTSFHVVASNKVETLSIHDTETHLAKLNSMHGFNASVREEILTLAQPKANITGTIQENLATISEPGYLLDELKLMEGKSFIISGVMIFRGNDTISDAICKFTKSDWSHTALCLKDQDGTEYCYESTGAAEEIFSGELPQVQIHRLFDQVQKYNGNVAVRPLVYDKGFEPDAKATTSLLVSLLGTPYEKRPLELIDVIWERNKTEDYTSLFCSEMNAYILQKLGYLPPESVRLANNYLPRDFGMDPMNAPAFIHAHLDKIQNLKHPPAKTNSCLQCALF